MASQTGYFDPGGSGEGISSEMRSKDLPSKRLLGKGLSSIGYETEWRGQTYARKDFVGVPIDIFQNEAIKLVGLNDHPNVVKTHGLTVDKMSCSLVLHYMDDDLLAVLQKRLARTVSGNQSELSRTKPFELPEALGLMLQIAKGMEYLHDQGILHGDLKTRNVLVAYVKDGEKNLLSLKVADFGLVRTKRKSMSFVSRQARKLDMVRWNAPEKLDMLLLEDKDETSSDSDEECTGSSGVSNLLLSTDVYSFAVMCVQILTGEDPYPDLNWKELVTKIVSDELRPNLPPACPPSLRDLLVLCWSKVPAERPTFTVIRRKLEHLQDITQADLHVLVDDESRDVIRREQPKVKMELQSISTMNCSHPGHHEIHQGEELQNHQLEDEREEHKEEGCSSERSPEAIFRLDKQGGSCSTASPSSTSTATGQKHKQLSIVNLTKYDVFLNHRGLDVKDFFVSHLEAALRRTGHDPFLDAKQLVTGQHAFQSINEALAGVLVHVAVFSPAYAESKYCLNELCDMLDSKKPVIPVYYNVKPEHLRGTEMGPFAGAFRKHLKKGRHKDVARWKAALMRAADITGFRRGDYANDEKLLEDVVAAVLGLFSALHPMFLEESSSRVIQMLHKMEGNVRVVGICGMGGIGKTALARHVYKQEQPSFANSCFLPDVNEAKGGAVKNLQMKMLKDLAHEDAFDSARWFQRIGNQKVLLVIDDVTEVELFEDLVPDLKQLGFGSEVLVTSRNRDVLRSIMRDISDSEVYDVPELSYQDSVQLFTWCAFQKNSLEAVDAPFHKFVEKITRACGGLPLALKVVGGFLGHKKNLPEDEKYWNEALSALRTNTDITTLLRTSYDNLDEEDCKCMFLDIACFMLSHPKEVALVVWESDERYATPHSSFDQLVQRCLVKVDSDGLLSMHDLLRDMGRNIVKEKASQKPEKLSHVWEPKTAEKLLQKEGVNEALAALSINGVDPGIACTAEAYSRLIELKYLSLDGYSVKGDFSKWSEEMTWLQWRYFPGEELPSSLNLVNLVVLDLANSPNLVYIWPRDNETQKLCSNLRILKLSNCSNLKMIPSNITQFVNLKFLYLNECLTLESLPDSSSELFFLETLDLSRCTKLQQLPPSICGLKKLRVLQMGYTAVVHLPADFGQLQSLTSIDFHGCRSLEDLPDSFSELCNLETLDLSRCTKLCKLPPSICGLKKLRVLQMGYTAVVHLPADFGRLQSLTSIDFQGCENLEDLPDSFSELCNLEALDLSRCTKLQQLPSSICGLKKLRVLQMGYTAVVHLPADFGRLQSLTSIDFQGCENLEDLPDSFSELCNLKTLDLSRCTKLCKLPPSICGLKKLRVLQMGYTAVVHLPADFGRLQSLTEVDLRSCENLEDLPDSFSELCNLETLDLSWCMHPQKLLPSVYGLKKLKVLHMGYIAMMHLRVDFRRLQSLTEVDFRSCESLEDLPNSFSALSNLEALNLSRCAKLRKLPPSICGLKELRVLQMGYTAVVHLPADFGRLQSLTSIDFHGCWSLEDLPDSFSELCSLETLDLSGCTKLQKLPPSICGLKKLRVLQMGYTAVVHLPADFGQLQSLTSIDFHGCRSLEDLPDSFSELCSLETLDVSGCTKLHKLPPSVFSLKKLRRSNFEASVQANSFSFWRRKRWSGY